MTASSNPAEELGQLRRMRLVSIVGGCTLLILVFVAVPIKHLSGHAIATTPATILGLVMIAILVVTKPF